MDVFDLTDYSDLVPRRVRKFLAMAFIVGLALLPPIREWYVHQAIVHGKHIADDIVSHFDTPPAPTPGSPPSPAAK